VTKNVNQPVKTGEDR